MIFEFKDLEQAKAFANEVWEQFHLEGRVFDDEEEAERVHLCPCRQIPPVVHIDRPWWTVPNWLSKPMHDKVWRMAFNMERRIEKLAEQFGGRWIGT
jgi:hypothetical protein